MALVKRKINAQDLGGKKKKTQRTDSSVGGEEE